MLPLFPCIELLFILFDDIFWWYFTGKISARYFKFLTAFTVFTNIALIRSVKYNKGKYLYKKNKNLADKHLSITYLQVNLNYTGVRLDAVSFCHCGSVSARVSAQVWLCMINLSNKCLRLYRQPLKCICQ